MSSLGGIEPQGKPENFSDVGAGLRDLAVHLHRGNAEQAESLVASVAKRLQGILSSGDESGSFLQKQAQQTLFAVEEVGTLLGERDFRGALTAARDAKKEWELQP